MYSGSGAPPLMNQRTCDVSAVANSGASISIFQIVGTPRTTVHLSSTMARHTSVVSKARWRTMVPPMVKMGSRNAPSPPAWYSGVKIELTSSSRSCQQATVL